MKALSNYTLRTKLIVSYVVFVVPILSGGGFFYYETARRSLDAELGERLVAVAQAAATRFNPLIISSLEPGDEQSRTFQSYRASLLRIRDRTNLKRLYVFDTDYRCLLDTGEGVPIGTPYARLHFQNREIEACKAGNPTASVLFRGDDGTRYKSGFAAIEDSDGSVAAFVCADASAGYLRLIADLRKSILIFVLLGAAVTVGMGFLLARSVSHPVSRLVSEAEKIGRGRMDRPVQIGKAGTRELAFLAEALDRMRERLGQREENQQMMVAGVAHEIRNPLGGIELFASLARQELDDGTEAAQYLDRVKAETGSLKTIINHFLEFARPVPVKPADLDLANVVEQAAELLSREARGKGAVFSFNIPAQASAVRADREQLARVFLNLFSNAVKALPAQGGKIVVTAQRRSHSGTRMVEVEVADNGCGMDRETLKKIFNPFYTTRDSGMGLGLAIVKKILEENNGWIEVSSETGKGARFKLYLPAGRPQQRA
ncbi:MAG: HAMP domain-containing sensor histidine kinase [Gemmatimonadota bacterium]|nr:HAMP domain-containing sensor histidine kinase [Gemmatimonadota bacterium]